MGIKSVEERMEEVSASLNYQYSKNWADQANESMTHQIRPEDGIVAIPGDKLTVTVDVSDSDGRIVVSGQQEENEFFDVSEAVEYALQIFFNDK